MKINPQFLLIFSLIVFYPIQTNSAEILQINSSNNILVGEQNRNLTIKLFCSNVNEDQESTAINLLKKEFPRGNKVKIKPLGFSENILIACFVLSMVSTYSILHVFIFASPASSAFYAK